MCGALASLKCDGRQAMMLAVACSALLVPTLGGERARALLRYERASLAAGQWWRLLTAHVVHLDLRHALLNCLGLVLMWALFAREYSVGQWLIVLLAAALAIDGGLWFGDSTIQWYVGSSGVLHGVMAAGALAAMRRGEREGWVLGVLLLLKLAYEHYAGALPFSGRDPVVVDAHLYGALGGSAVAAFLPSRRRSL